MQLMSSLPTIDPQTDYWMDRTDFTKPEFNLYTTSRSIQSLKQQSTGSMLNNNNTNTINNNNLTENQLSTNAIDAWCSDSDKLDPFDTLLFSPDSTKSSNSPSGLNSSNEESFIYETTICDTNLPVKYSQDYEDFEFVDEIDQISKLKEFNTDDYQNFKIEDDDSDSSFELSNSLEAKTVLYQDAMITGLAPPTILLDEDSYLVTVKNFNDLFMKPEKKSNNSNMEQINSQEIYEQNLSNYILTPAPSPKSPVATKQNIDDKIDDCENSSDCLNPANDMYKASSPAEDRLQLEHNYNLNINPYNNRIDEETNSCKLKLVTDRSSPTRQQEKRIRRVKPLKLKIPVNMRALRQDSVKMDVNTPDITNDILDMEDNKTFDLINYIFSSQDKNLTEPAIDLIEATTKPATPLDLEAIINEQCQIPTKRRRINSYENPGSVQSMTSTIVSDDSSTVPAPKRRGRPPKTECKLPSPSSYKHLSESDWKYMEMRNKNNEASRRSRINRKDREYQIESEARELENEFRILSEEEKSLLKQVAKWRNAVMKLAQI